jgi:hypothetical protein
MALALADAAFLETPATFSVFERGALAQQLGVRDSAHPTTREAFPQQWRIAAVNALAGRTPGEPVYLVLGPPPAEPPWRGAEDAVVAYQRAVRRAAGAGGPRAAAPNAADAAAPPVRGQPFTEANVRYLQQRLPPAAWQGAPDLAHLRWTADGGFTEVWRDERGRESRAGAPAFRAWAADGTLVNEVWRRHGTVTRADGPARRAFYPTGQPRYEDWYADGTSSRRGGAAYTRWDEAGNVIETRYFIDGRQVTREEAMAAAPAAGAAAPPVRGQPFTEANVRYLQQHLPPAAWQGAPDIAHLHWAAAIITEVWRDERGQRSRADGPAARSWSARGVLFSEEWAHHGRLTRADGPAQIGFYPSGRLQYEQWFADGRLSRRGGAASTGWDGAGNVVARGHYIDGREVTREEAMAAAREDGAATPPVPEQPFTDANVRYLQQHLPPAAWQGAPDRAHLQWTRFGDITERWRDEQRLLSRTDGPAVRQWTARGVLESEEWFRHGTLMRADGPARRVFRQSGAVSMEGWYDDGVQSRRGGAARTHWGPSGNILHEQYYIDGRRVTREEAMAAPVLIERRMWTARRTFAGV